MYCVPINRTKFEIILPYDWFKVLGRPGLDTVTSVVSYGQYISKFRLVLEMMIIRRDDSVLTFQIY